MLPSVEAHPSLNPVLQLLDRKRFDRAPKRLQDYLDIPAQYFALYANGDTEWVRATALQQDHERELVHTFEHRYKRSEALPCNSVKEYGPGAGDEDWESDDEVHLDLQARLRARG